MAEAADIGGKKKGWLTKLANEVFDPKHILKYIVVGLMINFFLFGLADFALFHNNPGGKALVVAVDSFFQGIFDTLQITDLLTWLAGEIGNEGMIESTKNLYQDVSDAKVIPTDDALDILGVGSDSIIGGSPAPSDP